MFIAQQRVLSRVCNPKKKKIEEVTIASFCADTQTQTQFYIYKLILIKRLIRDGLYVVPGRDSVVFCFLLLLFLMGVKRIGSSCSDVSFRETVWAILPGEGGGEGGGDVRVAGTIFRVAGRNLVFNV